MLQSKWLVGALAAALWMAPAGADDKSASDKTQDTASSAQQSADQAANRAGEAAGSAKRSTESAAESASTKAKAAGQQASSEVARTVAKLHAANEMEIEGGTWMKDHAANDKVKEFANKMVDDHGKMDKDVMSFAQEKGIDLTSAPKPADAAKGEHKAKLAQLKKMQGAQADREYMRMMVQDHEKDLKEVRDAESKAKRQKDDKLASLLGDTAKKIDDHLKDAREVQKSLQQRQARTPGASGSTGSSGTSDTGSAGTSSSGAGSGSSSDTSTSPSK
jgi:putative membrane protein